MFAKRLSDFTFQDSAAFFLFVLALNKQVIPAIKMIAPATMFVIRNMTKGTCELSLIKKVATSTMPPNVIQKIPITVNGSNCFMSVLDFVLSINCPIVLLIEFTAPIHFKNRDIIRFD